MADEPAMLMPYQGAWVPVTVRDMLRERDARIAALERENAAIMHDIVSWVADTTGTLGPSGLGKCCFCATKRWDDHQPDCPVTRARALLATQTPATGATAVGEVYTDRADHEHDWRQIESRTAPDVEGHLIVWHRTRCHVCGLISELSINPWTGATTGEEPCELCNGTGIYAQPVAWEDPDGTVGSDTSRITCHGCNGTGKRSHK